MKRVVVAIAGAVLVAAAVANIVLPSTNPFGARVRGSVVIVIIVVVLCEVAGVVHLRRAYGRLLIRVRDNAAATQWLRPVSLAAIVVGLLSSITATAADRSYSAPSALRAVGGTLLWAGVAGLIVRAGARRRTPTD